MSMTEDEARELNTKININTMFRRRVVEEDNLINQRMSCMIWAEAILLAAWSATFVKALETPPKAALRTVVNTILGGSSAFGIAIAAFSAIAIYSAWSEIKRTKDLYKSEFPELNRDSRLPELTGDSKNHLLGQFFPFIVPIGFLLLQAMLVRVWVLLPQ